MNRLNVGRVGYTAVFVMLMHGSALAELEPSCVANSPERHGGIGCSLVETKPLPDTLKEPLFWHIDRFDSGESARAAAGSAGVALEAHGTWWLLTIESRLDTHHGGQHVAQVELPPLPPASKYSMLVYSAYIPPGLTSRIHLHSGIEAFFVVDGEQCLETVDRDYPMHKGDILALPTGVTMRLVATGSIPRKALAVVVFDAAQPPTTRVEPGPALVSCR